MLFGILRLTPTPIKTPLRLFYGALYLDLKTYLITIPWGPIRAVRNAQPSIDKNTMHGISTHFTKTTNNKQQIKPDLKSLTAVVLELTGHFNNGV